MKVYESSHQTKRDFSKVPQIKIKNYKLIKSGFEIGKIFKVEYEPKRIILVLIEDQKANS